MRRKIGQPRFIDPSLIEIGDEISVEHLEDRGITMTLKGVVATRTDLGSTRYLSTEDNATILAWEIGRKSKFRVTLLAREEPEGATIFDLPEQSNNIEDLRRRLA